MVTDVTVIVGDTVIAESLPVDQVLITEEDLPEPKSITSDDLSSVIENFDLSTSIILPIVTSDTCDLIDDFVAESGLETVPIQLGKCTPKIQVEDVKPVETIADIQIEPTGIACRNYRLAVKA